MLIDREWKEEKLKKLMYYAKCNEDRDKFASMRKVSGNGQVYIIIKRRVKQ